MHVCGEGKCDNWHKRGTSKRENWLNRMQRACVFVALNYSLSFVLMESMASGDCAESAVPLWE